MIYTPNCTPNLSLDENINTIYGIIYISNDCIMCNSQKRMVRVQSSSPKKARFLRFVAKKRAFLIDFLITPQLHPNLFRGLKTVDSADGGRIFGRIFFGRNLGPLKEFVNLDGAVMHFPRFRPKSKIITRHEPEYT